MQRYLLLSALLCCPFLLPAQDSYEFEQLNVPYAELSGDITCVFDDGFDQITELGDGTFIFFATPFTLGADPMVWIGLNGYVRFDTEERSVIIDGLFTNISPMDGGSRISYTVTGAPGQRVLIAQWHNFSLDNGPNGNYANWQIAVHQANGLIEVHIGPNSGGGNLYTDVSGPNCGIFMAPIDFTSCQARTWIENNGNAPTIDRAATFDFDALHSLPDANTVFRLTPSTNTGVADPGRSNTMSVRVTGDRLEVRLMEAVANGELELLDASGRIVLRTRVQGVLQYIDINALTTGVHALRHVQANGTSFVRFLKE